AFAALGSAGASTRPARARDRDSGTGADPNPRPRRHQPPARGGRRRRPALDGQDRRRSRAAPRVHALRAGWVALDLARAPTGGLRRDAGAAAVVAKSANESEAARRQADATGWVFVSDDRREVEPGTSGASMLNRSGLVQHEWAEWVAILAEADDYARTRDCWVVASLIPADPGEL